MLADETVHADEDCEHGGHVDEPDDAGVEYTHADQEAYAEPKSVHSF